MTTNFNEERGDETTIEETTSLLAYFYSTRRAFLLKARATETDKPDTSSKIESPLRSVGSGGLHTPLAVEADTQRTDNTNSSIPTMVTTGPTYASGKSLSNIMDKVNAARSAVNGSNYLPNNTWALYDICLVNPDPKGIESLQTTTFFRLRVGFTPVDKSTFPPANSPYETIIRYITNNLDGVTLTIKYPHLSGHLLTSSKEYCKILGSTVARAPSPPSPSLSTSSAPSSARSHSPESTFESISTSPSNEPNMATASGEPKSSEGDMAAYIEVKWSEVEEMKKRGGLVDLNMDNCVKVYRSKQEHKVLLQIPSHIDKMVVEAHRVQMAAKSAGKAEADADNTTKDKQSDPDAEAAVAAKKAEQNKRKRENAKRNKAKKEADRKMAVDKERERLREMGLIPTLPNQETSKSSETKSAKSSQTLPPPNPFILAPSLGKDQGLFATHNIPYYFSILQETPILRGHSQLALIASFNTLSRDKKATLLAIKGECGCYAITENDDHCHESFVQKMLNAATLATGPDLPPEEQPVNEKCEIVPNHDRLAVYEFTSRANHSCNPNALRMFLPGGNVILRALRVIRKGEEITVCYTPSPMAGSAKDRRASLKTHWDFTCSCKSCIGGVFLKSTEPTSMSYTCLLKEDMMLDFQPAALNQLTACEKETQKQVDLWFASIHRFEKDMEVLMMADLIDAAINGDTSSKKRQQIIKRRFERFEKFLNRRDTFYVGKQVFRLRVNRKKEVAYATLENLQATVIKTFDTHESIEVKRRIAHNHAWHTSDSVHVIAARSKMEKMEY